MSKILKQIFSLVLIFSLAAPAVQAGTFIADENFRKAVKEQLGLKPTSEITAEQMGTIQSLLVPEKKINSLKGIEYAIELKELDISYNQIKGLGELNGNTALETLIADRNGFSSVEDLKNLNNIQWLSLGENEIVELDGLSQLDGLTSLSLFKNKISDIKALNGLSELEYLDLDDNQVVDLSPLAGHEKLTTLLISGNRIKTISPLKGMASLAFFYANDNEIYDLSPLAGLSMEDGEIELARNNIKDLSPLAGIKVNGLFKLDISENEVVSLEPLQNLHGLSSLRSSGNKITSLEPLNGLKELKVLDLSHNMLASLAGLNLSSNIDYKLDFSHNSVKDIKALESVTVGEIDLESNNIVDISPLRNLSAGIVNLKNNPLSPESLKLIDELRRKGVEVEFERSVTRHGGATRYDTAAEIARNIWSDADTIIITDGENFPDALAGAPLAYALDAPILLSKRSALPRPTMQVISELAPKKAVILGGTGAVPASVVDQLKTLGVQEFERIGGQTRFETAMLIANRLRTMNGVPEKAVIAYGRDFPDALAVASIAAEKGYPILLTERNSLPQETQKALTGISETIAVGGEGVISKAVFEKLPVASRIGGTDRFATANKITQMLGEQNAFYIANGRGFADALAGSVAAAKDQAQMLLVEQSKMSDETRSILKQRLSSDTVILGGEGVVGPAIAEELMK
ncbi:cell wall-binding repeat-containing protein [Mesobacillus subterraneus]|uniref:cell wall-binding repeat-containing protein n=1 Tax=Mesobacillus subterraneus TaxID=285983 RepID=UPI0020423285|nr:cell wall-binding repeat-containing protein [Mesobacillus subterraneus]MCM3663626.1 cell wall-binding repeat-containing protein [Mesobacillus subterraneus]MCM3683392.1 cell wall-binding repeat-containing protein [Mesobacillus subterraneus]